MIWLVIQFALLLALGFTFGECITLWLQYKTRKFTTYVIILGILIILNIINFIIGGILYV